MPALSYIDTYVLTCHVVKMMELSFLAGGSIASSDTLKSCARDIFLNAFLHPYVCFDDFLVKNTLPFEEKYFLNSSHVELIFTFLLWTFAILNNF